MRYKIVFASIIGLSVFAACSKKEDQKTQPTENVSLTAQEQKLLGSWKLVKAMSYRQDMTDSTDKLQNCLLDDIYTFKNTKKYDANVGNNDCGAGYYGTAQKSDIEWRMIGDTALSFRHFHDYRAGAVIPAPKIVELSVNKLILQDGYTAIGQYIVLHTYIKQ